MTRILVVEDDRLVLVGLANGLKSRGYTVDTADSGEAALVLALADEAQPDLVLIDICLPGISGIEVAAKICAEIDVPIIFLSALDTDDTVSNAIAQGTLSYLVKPITIKQLVPAVETALARSCDLKTLKASREHLSTALQQSRETSIAIGMLMQQHKLSAMDAFEMLRAHARVTRLKTSVVAQSVISGTLTLQPSAGDRKR